MTEQPVLSHSLPGGVFLRPGIVIFCCCSGGNARDYNKLARFLTLNVWVI